MTDGRRVAAGAFFCGYLLFQILYPALPWFRTGYGRFTWQMYAGTGDRPLFTVVFKDGSRRAIGQPTRFGASVRVLSSSVDQARFVPPWLCATWAGADRVIARHETSGREVALPCPPSGP